MISVDQLLPEFFYSRYLIRWRQKSRHMRRLSWQHYGRIGDYIIIIIIIIINCNWVVTRWQWLFYMYTNMKKVTTKFKLGGLHEKHVVATWKLGNHLSIRS